MFFYVFLGDIKGIWKHFNPTFMIPITKPFSPPIDEYQNLLVGIWERNSFTNNGTLVKQLELELKSYLDVEHLLYVSNGTIALQIAINALGVTKEIITTPFSYVATTSSIVWQGCKPIYVDIDPNTFNIDASKIEAAITDETEAILATHCFGNPCDIELIDSIAKKYDLKVIYDAAHCFGTRYKGKSIFTYGDVSTTSFHATKLYHTIEGGAIFTSDKKTLKKMDLMRNFGHNGAYSFDGCGINGKNSEFHAAMGLINLKYIDEVLIKREQDYVKYKKALNGPKVKLQNLRSNTLYNYSYFPILLESEELVEQIIESLEENQVFLRRYFFPSLNTLNYVEGNAPICEDLASRILCLPLYFDLELKSIEFIIKNLLAKIG